MTAIKPSKYTRYRMWPPCLATAMIAVAAIAVALPAQAQVVPNAASGTWSTGETIHIAGSGFGAKDPAPPVLWDRVSNQAAYASLSNGDTVPVRGEAPWYGMLNTVSLESANVRIPGTSVYVTRDGGVLTSADLGRTEPTQMYLNWWIRPTVNISGESNKFIRAWADYSGIAPSRLSWTSMHLTHYALDANCTPYSTQPSWGDWGGTVGEWNNLEITIDGRRALTCGEEGRVVASTNGRVIHDTGFGGTEPLDTIWMLGFNPTWPELYAGEPFYFGDIYFDITQARVVLGNAPTYAECTHIEMQIPETWSTSAITVQANLGSFSTNELWLYVFDENGDHNAVGLPISSDYVPAPGAPGRPQR